MEIQTINEILYNIGLLINSYDLKNLETHILKKEVKTRKISSPSKNKSYVSIYFEEPEIIKKIIFEWLIENNLFINNLLKELNIILKDEQKKELVIELKKLEIVNLKELKKEIRIWWNKIPKNVEQILNEIKLLALSEKEEKSLYDFICKQTGLKKEELMNNTYNTIKIIKYVQRWIKTLPNCYGSIIIYNLDDVGTSIVDIGHDGKEEIKLDFNEEFEIFFEKCLKLIDYDRKRVKGLYDPLSPNAWKHDFLEYGEIYYFGPLEVPEVVLKWLHELIRNSQYSDNFFISGDYDLLERKITKRKEEILDRSFEKIVL